MANAFITKYLGVLRRNKSIKDMMTFWTVVGRDDLVGSTYDSLFGAPALQTILHEAEKVVADRNDVKDSPPPEPLTHFMHEGPDGATRYYELRETKGWKRSKMEVAEVKTAKASDRKVPMLKDLPGGTAFDRWRAAA